MRKHIIVTAVIIACLAGGIAAGSAVNAYFDFVQANTLGAPATGLSRLSVNATTKKMICTNSDSSSCLPSSGGGAGYTPFANFTALANTGWTWINQGSSTVTFAGGIVSMHATGTGAFNLQAYVQTLPAAPWTIIGSFLGGLGIDGTNGNLGGYANYLCLTDGTKFAVFGVDQLNGATTGSLEVNAYSTVTSFSGGFRGGSQIQTAAQPVFWFRISDDGTNWNFYYSADPTNIGWTLFFTEAHNTFVTATSAGFAFDLYSSNLSGIALNSNALMSWAITTP